MRNSPRLTLSVIVPVLNEGRTLAGILDRLLALEEITEIVVVDDGSTDDTATVAESYCGTTNTTPGAQRAPDSEPSYPSAAVEAASAADPALPRVKLVKHDRNRGKGAAIRTGLLHVTGAVTVIQDGDLEYDPNDFKNMLDRIREGAGVVYGSRILGRNQFSYRRFLYGGKFLTLLANLLYGTSITDEPTCYKMARTDLYRRMNLECTGFEFCPEVTAKFARLNERIVEIPIAYNPRSIEEGKKIRWTDGIIAIGTLLKYRFWRERRP
ncbi:MAG: glycosyltransferase family 2 protein [Candidatus Hydrogenedentota bacterium]